MKKIIYPILIYFFAISASFAQLTVDTTATPPVLVNTIAAGGVAVSNISYTGVQWASGTFLCAGACNIGISGGILLTSGDATLAANVNTSPNTSMNNVLSGDLDLDALVAFPTNDASVLEFDFVALSDTVQFNYVFASEEYIEYVCSQYNDIFAFFISGPGITNMQNIALIPGTSDPVSINNVNNGVPAGTASCILTNSAYFLDNDTGFYTTEYDGLTVVLTAIANVQPGQTYHLKLAIADVYDYVYDSGVFLEAGSFRIAGPPAMYVGGNRITGNTVHICQGSSVSLSVPAGFSYLWSTGETTQSITVSQAGTYNVTITGTNINFPVISPGITFIVDNTVIPAPVLSQNFNTITSSVNSPNYNYSWTVDGNPVPGAAGSSITVSEPGCYSVTIQDPGGCFVTSDTLCIIALGINELSAQHTIKVIPNPFSQSATFTFDNPLQEQLTLKVFDVIGKEIKQFTVSGTKFVLERENLSDGIYFYELKNKKESHKGKFVIN